MNGNQQMQDSSKLILMAKGRGTKQNKRKTKLKNIFLILLVFLFFCHVLRKGQFAAGSSILCYSFLCLSISFVLFFY